MFNELYRYKLIGIYSICIIALLVLYFANAAIKPKFLFGSYRVSQSSITANHIKFYRLPFEFKEKNRIAAVKLHLNLPPHHASKFNFFADDCLESLKINSKTVSDLIFPICGHKENINLQRYLRKGLNTFVFTVSNKNGPGRFDIRVSANDWYSRIINGIFILMLFTSAIYYGLRLKLSKREFTLLLLFFGGVTIRCIYCFATPYWIRAYDWFEHLDYILYLSQHWSIPNAKAGFEFHQPPFYYFIASLYQQASHFFGLRYYEFIAHLQILSLLFSIGSLSVGFWILQILPKIRNNSNLSYLFAAIIAFAPSGIYSSSRISNDALAELLGIIAIAYLLKWWNNQNSKYLYLFSIVTAFSLLSKLTMLPVLGTALAIIGLKKESSSEERAKLILIPILAIGLICGWYFIERVQDVGSALPHKSISINDGLKLDNQISNYLVFNPIEFFKHPFNNSWKDSERRQYFWEYLYRSAFFGEFSASNNVHWLAIAILYFALPIIPIAFGGAYVAIRDNWHLHKPISIFGILLILSLLVWRVLVKCSPAQDFRLISLIIIPIAYFSCRGIEGLDTKYKKALLMTLAVSPALWVLWLIYFCFLSE